MGQNEAGGSQFGQAVGIGCFRGVLISFGVGMAIFLIASVSKENRLKAAEQEYEARKHALYEAERKASPGGWGYNRSDREYWQRKRDEAYRQYQQEQDRIRKSLEVWEKVGIWLAFPVLAVIFVIWLLCAADRKKGWGRAKQS